MTAAGLDGGELDPDRPPGGHHDKHTAVASIIIISLNL